MKPVKQENQAYLKEQILTYLGNKRSLLGFIERGVKYAKDELKKEKLSCCDLFSGSGVVARFLKQNSEFLVANDLELYSFITNSCYLQNATNELRDEINSWQKKLEKEIKNLEAATEEDALLLGKLQLTVAKVARILGINEEGYRVITNIGENGGQEVLHIHYHILGGEKLPVTLK